MDKRKRGARRGRKAAIILAAVILGVLLLDLIATKLVYDGIFVRYDEPPLFIESDYADAFLRAEDESFESCGNELAAKLYIPREPNGVLAVLAPGMHAGYAELLPLTSALAERGYTVFCFDPTGCRGSGCDGCVGFYQTVYDLDACLGHVERSGLYGCRELVVIGHSRGGYAACIEADSAHGISAVVSISAPDSSMDAVIGSSSGLVGSVSAYANYPALWLYQTKLFGAGNVEKLASRKVKSADIPVLIVHGAGDTTVRADAHSVYARLLDTSSKAELLLLPGGHTDVIYAADGTVNAELIEAVCGFFGAATTQ